MNTTTETAPVPTRWIDDYAVEIRGRRFTVEAHTDYSHAGRCYELAGPKGAPYLGILAYTDDAHTFKLLAAGRGLAELRLDGNMVRLTDADGGTLREVTR